MKIQTPKLLLSLTFAVAFAAPAWAQPAHGETDCANRVDDDGDGLPDCADADCYGKPACMTAGGLENTDALCSDFIDNDGDGALDCEDMDCAATSVTVCRGSWRGPLNGSGVAPQGTSAAASRGADLPDMREGMSVEDLLGTGKDKDGERNDQACSDGIDNDGDGAIDCADFGCRFDPSVTICQNAPSLRFSVIANVMTQYDFEAEDGQTPWDTRFNRLQLRTFGPLPYVQDSFFYVSVRADRTPRFTFAFVSFPVWGDHFLNVNSGGGGLSNGQVISAHKNMLLEVPYFLYNAFEQGNGAAVELSGPVALDGRIGYRVFAAGGSGRSDGNIGGRYYKGEKRNYTWGVGGQLSFDLAGHFSRWDTRMLYTPASLAATLYLGTRYDERDAERYTATNLNLLLRWSRLIINLEGYMKRELNFGAWQWSYNAQLGLLVLPKWLMIAGDVGQFYADNFDTLPAAGDRLKRPNDEFQWRVGAHLYLWRTVGVLSLLYTDGTEENQKAGQDDDHNRTLRLQFAYRF